MTFQAACYLALLLRLVLIGLAGRYRFLCSYLVLQILGTAGLSWIPFTTRNYALAYFCITPTLWVLSYLVVLELCWLILEDYPGIAAAGRRIINCSTVAAMAVAAGFALYGFLTNVGRFPFLRSFAIVHLSVRVGVLAFLFAILFFVYRFRLELPRNRRLYCVGYSACWGLALASDALSMRMSSASHEAIVNSVEMLICSALLIAGTAMLNPDGERQSLSIHPDANDNRAALHRRLKEMNSLLVDVGGRVKK